eukprot:CAMPEP_0172498374 /NCGR_PEP_ID=MMETSP1066-20121228/113100_1 /TAXON_ID=671091 /ORGANISM="Coscinodiscus wailesii, Strain CCMP2513" /LENGTH=124 /DNA_ID=CAMNT_0013271635 /DNA_START=51 /DNA_END=422 /DNA_ORIENTATION=+
MHPLPRRKQQHALLLAARTRRSAPLEQNRIFRQVMLMQRPFRIGRHFLRHADRRVFHTAANGEDATAPAAVTTATAHSFGYFNVRGANFYFRRGSGEDAVGVMRGLLFRGTNGFHHAFGKAFPG